MIDMKLLARHLDIDLLRTLVSIADSGSFSAAAERMGRTQSAISLQIKRLEENVGHLLLDRSQGRVEGPTAEGRLLLDYARRILRLNDEAYGCFFPSPVSGQLRVGLPEELMESVFPAVLKKFAESHPQVELSVFCDLSARLIAKGEAGELDLVLAKQVTAHPLVATDAGWKRMRREPLVWLAGGLASEGSVLVNQESLPVGVFQEGCVFRTAALTALAGSGRAWRLAFVGSSYTALRHAVRAGIAVAPLALSLASPGLSVVRSGLPELPDVELIACMGRPGREAARRLLELFEAELWQQP
ncbi:LysR substrate-binding domain-containing protein [Thauera sp.]|uniref:LysR substrate-binding domain-containing protein n=1 Tax=Thauera sp. TaxID=1905334 RepID=UPI0039E2EAD8